VWEKVIDEVPAISSSTHIDRERIIVWKRLWSRAREICWQAANMAHYTPFCNSNIHLSECSATQLQSAPVVGRSRYLSLDAVSNIQLFGCSTPVVDEIRLRMWLSCWCVSQMQDGKRALVVEK
jgi:hypothetical protein